MTLSVCIIGAGPAGFYTAQALLDRRDDVHIDIIERLPTPFGLVRAGVAPDHQSVKQVARKFEQTALRELVQFYGNVEVGRDVAIAELRVLYDAVILAVGSPTDRPLGIPGEHKRGVYGASAFVGWYNGHPDFGDLDPDLDTPRAVIIGNGNVALDIARVLLKSRREMAATDLVTHAARLIAAAPLREVAIVGRRGPAQARFAPAELREMGEIADCEIVVGEMPLPEAPPGADTRVRKNLRIFAEFAERPPRQAAKRLYFRFFLAPVEIIGEGRVTGIRCERTTLDGDRAAGTGRFETIACGLVVAAIGYRATQIPGVPYDADLGLIPNDDGRVEPGLYVVGWAKRGPTGVIGSNRPDGERCAEQICADFASGAAPGRAALEALLRSRGVRVVTFADWQRIDAAEIEAAVGPAPRRKLTSLQEMLWLIAGDDAGETPTDRRRAPVPWRH